LDSSGVLDPEVDALEQSHEQLGERVAQLQAKSDRQKAEIKQLTGAVVEQEAFLLEVREGEISKQVRLI
jgi:peptidoglycan hydrolase CwlO-like protein